MDHRINRRKAELAEAAYAQGLIGADAPIAGLIDLDAVAANVAAMQAAFPQHFLHAFAAKANCSLPLLHFLEGLGVGCEVASPGELEAAVEAGFAADRVVFDSPAKTKAEIREALARGFTLNIDNFQELDRVAEALSQRPSNSTIGIRINPQVGGGSIAAMSTATETSKFGIGLEDEGNRDQMIAAYRRYPWLTALHTHIGSQGIPIGLTAAGIAKTVAFAEEIDRALGEKRIKLIDIGGGLSVNFADDRMVPSFAEYATSLRAAAPALFAGDRRIVTEFGRALLAKPGLILARVEYTKTMGGKQIAITHAGAQVATRTVFMPEHWPIRVGALDAQARPKAGPIVAQDVAGPCCFAGDVIAHGRLMPLLEPGDWVMAQDTGAYYFSTPFHYNALPPVPVYGASGQGNHLRFAPL